MRIETPDWLIEYYQNLYKGNNMCPDTPEQMISDLKKYIDHKNKVHEDQIKALNEKLDLIIKHLKLEFEEVPAQERYLRMIQRL